MTPCSQCGNACEAVQLESGQVAFYLRCNSCMVESMSESEYQAYLEERYGIEQEVI